MKQRQSTLKITAPSARPATPGATSDSTSVKTPRKSSFSSGLSNGAAKTPTAVATSGIAFEITRLRDELQVKQRECEKANVEITTLRSKVAATTKALDTATKDKEALKDKLLITEGGLSAKAKELQQAVADRARFQSEAKNAALLADRLTQKIANMPKGNKFSEEIAALESKVRELKMENAKVSEDNKACYTMIRNKDREIEKMQDKVSWAEKIEIQNKELENIILDQKRSIEELKNEITLLQKVKRQKEADISELTQRLEDTETNLLETNETLAKTSAELQATTITVTELNAELSLAKTDLARTGVVAARVAVNEIKAGTKDEGMVPVALHIEEIHYLHGEMERLKEKLKHMEKSLASSNALRDQLQRKLDAASSPGVKGISVHSRRNTQSPAQQSPAQSPRSLSNAPQDFAAVPEESSIEAALQE